MIKIVKASAGSGKTYNLAKEYIMLLLTKGGKDAYKHILAVTFTNKATDEMKSRILQELYVLSTDPSLSPYIDDLREHFGGGDSEIQKVVKETLTNILHDYGMFSVSTIDRFFQQTLRAFSREIGQFASYQLELDKDSLIQEAVDRILDSLEEGTEIFNWLVANVREQIEENGRYNLQAGLVETANSLKSTEYQTKVEQNKCGKESGYPDYSKKRLDEIRKICVKIMRDFEKTGDLKKPSKEYVTAKTIKNQIYGLGMAGEFYDTFDALMKEKNVLYIDETNAILRDIISGSDIPFIYEKTGVRYENFLIDEFQDTSRVQWDNFRPLLKESDDSHHENYIVGDVKQSIYRWRNSDWNLLARELKEAFPLAQESTLDTNFRSYRNIVAFNNAFFQYLAAVLDNKSADRPAGSTSVSEIYEDVRQKCNKTQDGCVKLVFCPKSKTADYVCGEVVDAIRTVCSQGGEYSDIAILVRTKANGARIANFLIENGIPVITNDSLSVKSSSVVNKLVSLLSFIDNPDDTVTSYLAKPLGIQPPKEYHSMVDLCEYLLRALTDVDASAVQRDVAYIRTFMDEVSSFAQTNGNSIRGFLQHWETAEPVISSPAIGNSVTIMTIHKAKGLDFPYVIYPYAGSERMYSPDFHWCVLPPDASPALKGCENLYKVKLTSSTAGSFFAQDYVEERYKQYVDDINVLYVVLTRPVKVLHIISGFPTKNAQTKGEKDPCKFSDFSSLKDALYLFTATEAAKELGYDYYEEFPDETDETKKTIRYQYGQMPDFGHDTKGSSVTAIPASYPSWELNAARARLAVSYDNIDLFADDDAPESGGVAGSQVEGPKNWEESKGGKGGKIVSPQVKGTVLHSMLSSIIYPEDLDKTISGAVMNGDLTPDKADDAREFLDGALRSAISRGWFAADAVVRNEAGIIDTDGNEYRPDRVEIHPDGRVTVIDYKFGKPQAAYKAQVCRYADLWKRMGCSDVSAFVWYVLTDTVEQYC